LRREDTRSIERVLEAEICLTGLDGQNRCRPWDKDWSSRARRLLFPLLRERREDIPTLVSHFVSQFARHMNKKIESIASETVSDSFRVSKNGRPDTEVIFEVVARTFSRQAAILSCPLSAIASSSAMSSEGTPRPWQRDFHEDDLTKRYPGSRADAFQEYSFA